MGGVDFFSERPPHRVGLSPYWIGRTEVTNAMYRRSWRRPGHPPLQMAQEERFSGNEQPVVGVDWADAAADRAWAEGQVAHRGGVGVRSPRHGWPPLSLGK